MTGQEGRRLVLPMLIFRDGMKGCRQIETYNAANKLKLIDRCHAASGVRLGAWMLGHQAATLALRSCASVPRL